MEYTRHIRRTTIVDSIEEAFAFCLTGIEEEGISLPVTHIEPIMFYDEDSDEPVRRYEATVSGEA